MSYTHSGGTVGQPIKTFHDENDVIPVKRTVAVGKPGWNLFRSTAKGDVSVSDRKYDDFLKNAYKALKMFTMVVVFFVTLAATIVSKGCTFLMVSQVSAHNQIKPLALCPSDLPGGHLDLINQGPFTYPTDRTKVGVMTIG